MIIENKNVDLLKEVGRVKKTIEFICHLLDVGSGDITFLGPSRHLVAGIYLDQNGLVVLKSYEDSKRYKAEIHNLGKFNEINAARSPIFKESTSLDEDYLALPYIDTSLASTSTFDFEHPDIRPFALINPIGDISLYEMMLKGTAEFEHLSKAVIQIARIQQEGKIHERALGLEDVIKEKETNGNDYFTKRFEDVFLGNLTKYTNIKIPEGIEEEMKANWRALVSQNLIKKTPPKGYYAFYYDGQPSHHRFDSKTGKIICLDLEYRIITTALSGLANLLSFGITDKKGKLYVSPETNSYLFDRFLFEIAFVEALRGGKKDLARDMFSYVSKRYKAKKYDLSGKDPDDFFKFLGGGDLGTGKNLVEEYKAVWTFNQFERQILWIGHLARYIELTKLFLNEGIRLQMEDPEKQYRSQQRQLFNQALYFLESLKETFPNGKAPATTLLNRFSDIKSESYFIQNK